MDWQTADIKTELTTRLRRIEGQVKGVERMVDEGRDCADILQQMSAIRSAVHQASLVLARAFATQCIAKEPGHGNTQVMLDTLMTALGRLD